MRAGKKGLLRVRSCLRTVKTESMEGRYIKRVTTAASVILTLSWQNIVFNEADVLEKGPKYIRIFDLFSRTFYYVGHDALPGKCRYISWLNYIQIRVDICQAELMIRSESNESKIHGQVIFREGGSFGGENRESILQFRKYNMKGHLISQCSIFFFPRKKAFVGENENFFG